MIEDLIKEDSCRYVINNRYICIPISWTKWHDAYGYAGKTLTVKCRCETDDTTVCTYDDTMIYITRHEDLDCYSAMICFVNNDMTEVAFNVTDVIKQKL